MKKVAKNVQTTVLIRTAWAIFLCMFITVSLHSAPSGNVLTKKQYLKAMNKVLNDVIKRCPENPGHKLLFSANLFFAHGAAIRSMPLDILKLYVDAFREAGVNRVDINLGIWPWAKQDATTIHKYVELIRYIRNSGLGLALNPVYNVTDGPVESFNGWANETLEAFRKIGAQLKPDIFVVIHEPSTINARMKLSVSPARWAEFARKAALAVKESSPETRCGAGVLWTETSYFNAFLNVEPLSYISLDIYALRGLKTYNEMIPRIRKAGKKVYIEETWRPPYFIPSGSKKETLETWSAAGIGENTYRKLDCKWMKAMVRYANTWKMEAVTPFWTQTFFLYVPKTADTCALSPDYNGKVMEAIKQQKRTATFKAFRKLVRKFGKK